MNWINLLLRGSSAIEKNTSWIAHLEELRKRLIWSLVVFVVVMIGSLTFVGRLYGFLSRPLDGLKLAVLGPGEVVQVYFMIAGIAAFAVSSPFLLWQIWKFVSPGLYPRERNYARRLILPTAIMFLVGISFGYFIIFPEILTFLKNLSGQNFRLNWTALEYFSFMVNIVFPFGLLFEMPIVIVFLTRIGILTPKWLRKMRRFAYFIFVLIGVLISPPELISHLSVVVPMVLIYEISIWLAEMAYRRKLASESWWRENSSADAVDPTDPADPTSPIGPIDPIDPIDPVRQPVVDNVKESFNDEVKKVEAIPVFETGVELSESDIAKLQSQQVEHVIDDELPPELLRISERILSHMKNEPILASRPGISLVERE